ncbi:GPP34 family phosphoprotein [Streptomyces sp. AC512_CC834]|uniref:GOLPH3/VPS74 family protein n=1 Tax=Streptomyces sp. AC512_CC834 TaxID=2823691 RepID=UPI001C2692BE|nr:GPP34 family phosphoprotein [Streptomyces sp. AC512_CC834]
MRLTLPQKLYLLCYTVDQEKFKAVDLQGRGQLLRAGALAELAFAGLLGAEGGKVRRRTGEPPADSFAGEVWRDLPAERPKGWLRFLHNKAHTAEGAVRGQLVAAGAITPPEKRSLSPLSSHHVSVADPGQVLELQARARDAVLTGRAPAEIPTEVSTMTVLAVECEVSTVFTGKERRAHKQSLKALAAHFDELVPGLRRALRDSFLSSRGVGGGWGS